MSDSTEVIHGDPECRYKALTARVSPAVDPDSAVDVACFMSTDSVDGDDEVLLPGGCDLSRFEKNPVVMLCHAYGQPGSYYPLPIGKAEWTKTRPRGVLAGVRFTDKTPMGREVKALFEDDMLRSFSVGFIPREASPMTHEEAQSRPDWKAAYERTKGRVNVHRKWQLLELSVAPVPSNPDALRLRYVAKGLSAPAWLSLPTPIPETSPMGETIEKCPGAMQAGMHVRHKSGACGTVKSVEDGMAEVDTHDEKCAPTGVMKSYACKDLSPYGGGDGDGDEDDGMKAAKPKPREGSAEEEANETPTEEAAEDMEEEDGEAAEGGGFRAGHHVRISVPKGYKGVGVVKSIHRKGHVPHVAENIRGTDEEPAARVEAYKAMGDGHEATGDHVGVMCKHLTHLPEEMKAPTKKAATPAAGRFNPKGAPVTVTPAIEPLPPLVALSDEEVQRRAIEGIKQIPSLVNQAVERAMGFI